MRNGQPGSALRQLRALFAAGTATARTDGELLATYVICRQHAAEAAISAESAFAALVDRHGPMVWGVCRRILGDVHEAEDAFQATFLVLVRKAGSIRVDDSLGRWLYGVAHRVAGRARAERVRREADIDRPAAGSSDDPAEAAELVELRAVVSDELDRLPAKYRCPLELFQLQGLTYEQAASRLAWPVATVKSRLARGRAKLRGNLVKRGLAPAASGVASSLAASARADVPPKLIRATVWTGTNPASGALPAAITGLSEGVLKMMMWEKIRVIAAGAFLAIGLSAHAVSQVTREEKPSEPASPQAAAIPDATKTADAIPVDPLWTRTLPCGARIEILGVSDYPTKPNTWWRPDGTPQPPLCSPADHQIVGDSGRPVAFLARVTNIPEGSESDWKIEPAGSTIHLRARQGKTILPNLLEMVTLTPLEATHGTAHFRVAAGPWNTCQTWGPSQGAVGGISVSYIFSAPIATQEGTVLSVTHNIQDKSVRVIAIDLNGQQVEGKTRSGSGVRDFHQLSVEFGLPPARIKEFCVQSRSFEQVDIPGIALRRK